MSAEKMLKKYAKMVEDRLNLIFDNIDDSPQILKEAMEYSIMAGGKRIRPALMLEFYRCLGKDPSDILNFACAVEMIHNYSLIHDDLPCMDNDDMRRGKPSCHIAFGEDYALLAGDSLLTLAFETAADINDNLDAKKAVRAIKALANAAGLRKMAGGQVLDLQSENKSISEEQLEKIHEGKTVAMIKVNAQIACILAGADDEVFVRVSNYCVNLGKAFQIRDDILDLIGNEESFGKPVGSDQKQQKNTYVTFYGLEKSQQIVEELTQKAKQDISIFGDESEDLVDLADQLSLRYK